MIHSVFGKVYITSGEVFNSETRAIQLLAGYNIEIIELLRRDTIIQLNDENILEFIHQGEKYPFSFSALKNLSKILKLPTQFINKTASSDLTEKIINECPLKHEGQWNVILRYDKELDLKYVAGIREGLYLSSTELYQMLAQSNLPDRNNLEFIQYTISNDISGIFMLSKETFTHRSDMSFDYRFGLGLIFSETSDQGFSAFPYYEIKVKNAMGEELTFDFMSNQALVKINGKSQVLSQEISKFFGEIDIGIISEDFENMEHLLRASLRSDQINYLLLKKARSLAKKPFAGKSLREISKDVDSEIIPEYNEFRMDRKEDLKTLPSFMSNNISTNFYFPLFYHRIFHYPVTVENPDAYIVSKQVVYSLMINLAENINIGNIS